jgi:hypothetical protein
VSAWSRTVFDRGKQPVPSSSFASSFWPAVSLFVSRYYRLLQSEYTSVLDCHSFNRSTGSGHTQYPVGKPLTRGGVKFSTYCSLKLDFEIASIRNCGIHAASHISQFRISEISHFKPTTSKSIPLCVSLRTSQRYFSSETSLFAHLHSNVCRFPRWSDLQHNKARLALHAC